MGKDFGNLLSESWNEYKKNFKLIFRSYIWFYIIPGVIFLLFGIMFFSSAGSEFNSYVFGNSMFNNDKGGFNFDNDGFDFNIGKMKLDTTKNTLPNFKIDGSLYPLVGIGFVILLVMCILNYMLYLSLFYLSFNQKKNLTTKDIIKGGLKYFWLFIGLFVLIVLALIPLFILLIIPGIAFMVYWVFSPFVLFGENQRIVESMKKSFHLVRYKWWRTFGYVLLFGLIVIGYYFLVGLMISIFTLPIRGTGIILVSFKLIFNLISGIIGSIVITPLSIFFFKNFYLEMKKNPIKIRR